MADIMSAGKTEGCNETCGCPSPCPGGQSCRCTSSSTVGGGGGAETEHMRCSCGEHCGCNPCRCSKEEVAGVGKNYCKCGEGCGCVPCKS